MTDTLTIRNQSTGSSFTPAPEGQFSAVCVDVIDLGEKVEQYQQNPAKLVRKVALVFQIAETNEDTGKPYEPSVEFTLSFNEKAALRKFLERWRGKAYTEAEAGEGVPLHKLDGRACLLSLEHKVSAAGRTYAKINNVSPLPKGLAGIAPTGYVRADFWTTRREEYAAEAGRFRATTAPKAPRTPEAVLATADEDDALPF